MGGHGHGQPCSIAGLALQGVASCDSFCRKQVTGHAADGELSMQINRFILASGSVFRAELLRRVGLNFEVIPGEMDEESITASSPAQIAVMRAVAKAQDVARNHAAALVLGADQTLDFAGESYGKAATPEEAKERLRLFAGHSHFLRSAYALVVNDGNGMIRTLAERVVSVEMKMRPLTDAEIDGYVATGEWQGCAGCYRFEELGSQLFAAVHGNDAAIIGLPLVELGEDLRRLGINLLLQREAPWQLQFV
jgi:septum formation protein